MFTCTYGGRAQQVISKREKEILYIFQHVSIVQFSDIAPHYKCVYAFQES